MSNAIESDSNSKPASEAPAAKRERKAKKAKAAKKAGRAKWVPLDRLDGLMDRWIPTARVLHPYPMQRFDASHPRREPYA